VLTSRRGGGAEDVPASVSGDVADIVPEWEAPDENGVIRLTDVPPGPFKVVDYTLKKQSGSDGS
jgi:hypothetical protein